MNFNSHIRGIHKDLLICLALDKEELISELSVLTRKVATLLKDENKSFDFWLEQLDKVAWDEFPVTRYAIKEQQRNLEKLVSNQRELNQTLGILLERILTYWEEDDLCEMQGQFFYFKNGITNQIFCESEFGQIRTFGKKISMSDVTIATISDLRKNGVIGSKNEGELI